MDNSRVLRLMRLEDMEEILQRHRFMHAFPRRRLRIRDKGEAAKQPRFERILVEGDVLGYVPNEDNRVGVYISPHPLTPDNNYFEVEILDTGLIGAIAIGLVPCHYPLDRQPGWNSESVGYHADDGKLFKANGFGRVFGPKNYIGDKVGCGIIFDRDEDEEGHKPTAKVFFTRNGKEIGKVAVPVPAEGLYPAIGMHSEGEEVRLNLEAEWQAEDVILMAVDNCEEEWSRLHDVKLNGSILEYTGRGKSIIDVGLAQARFPLDTTYHYFEIEIVDPGENCYIAIGLARRDYPKHRHPGWNRGSIAYHADDGKIFVGSGVGDPFGPRCHKGDIMGCGILFPRDYNSDADSDGSSAASPDYPNVEELLLEDYHTSDSDEEEFWGPGAGPWEKPIAEYGAKVKIFFTRNGKTIGQKEIRMPKGGFYPTVGMLSSDEKVRVDLRPLTG
ncbi:SPRY domain-containing protein 3-like isoform X2 [Liolophura sinensis]|uniref:SPRY domain-containing protein 3-like isoform X2 n=1 Tax=Liolophura sinensis TaxID=3198878 RepID=UPI0031596138